MLQQPEFVECKFIKESSWFYSSIAQSSVAILDFFWGPMMTLVAINEEFFSIYFPWSLVKKNSISEHQRSQDNSQQCRNELDRGTLAFVSDCEISNLGKALADNGRGDYTCCLAREMDEVHGTDEVHGVPCEMDMLAFSGCTHSCTEQEANELKRMRILKSSNCRRIIKAYAINF